MHKASKKWSVLLVALALFAAVAAACQAAPETTDGGGSDADAAIAELEAQLTAIAEGGGSEQAAADAQATIDALQAELEATDAPTEAPVVDRNGGWFDTIVAVEEPNAAAAVTRLLAGDIDAYLFAVGDPQVYATIVDNDADLDWWPSYGLSDEFTFNTHGPTFNNGELNPFSVPAVREAVNWLIDRDYIVNEIMGGLGAPRYTTISTVDPDYVQYIDVISELEAYYAYDPDKANEAITAEMEELGATLDGDGKWTYADAPVNIIIVIRTEDKRREIGDYLATQLESIGFTVTRDYKNFSDAATCWRSADPAEGCFHVYTGGWSSSAISLDSGTNFGFWYTALGGISVNSATYAPSEEFQAAADALWSNSFTSLEERNELFEVALRESVLDSTRVWIVDQKTASPYSADFVASGDLAGGLSGSSLWAYTMRPVSGVGGAFNIAMPSILSEPWNPIQGSNALYDAALQRAVGETGLVADPFTGHPIPMHVESATVTHQAELPVYATKDWVAVDTADEITVPGDAWVGWDAVEQRFITVEEAYPDGVTAQVKSTVVYPADIFDLKWHDGSNLSVGDFVMFMITTLDLGQEDSPYYEVTSAAQLEAFLATFRGVKIVSTDPLTIEHYTDSWFTNAELNVTSWWPYYLYGQAPWHTMALGLMSQEAGTLGFSADTALELEVEQMSFISGPSIEVLAGNLATATAENFIPYGETLSEYISADEATARYTNLTEWHRRRGHFWLGTGPYFLQRAFPIEGTVILEHNPAYPHPADRWAGYATPNFPVAALDGPTEVAIGETASYTVTVADADGNPYAAEDVNRVVYLVFDAEGNLVQQGQAEGGDNGQYTVSFETGDLTEGSNRLQVIVVSNLVGVPVFVEQQFVTTQ